MMNEKIYDCIVVGGGISGVSFAYTLSKAGKTVLLLDSEAKIGGQICTEQYERDADYWFEMGAHTCYNSYANLISIINESGFRENVQPLLNYKYVVFAKHKIRSIFSQLSVIRMIPKCFNYFSATKTGKTVKEFFLPIVGEKNYNRLFRYAFRAVLCQPADDYPAEIFLKKRETRDKTYPRKFTFKKGLSSLITHLLSKYNTEYLLKTVAINIGKENEIYTVSTRSGAQFQAKNICLAAGHESTALLMKDLEGKISEDLSAIHTYRIQSVGSIIDKKRIKLKKIAGIISLSDDFLSAVSRDLIKDKKRRSFAFHYDVKYSRKLNIMSDISTEALGIHFTAVWDKKYMEHSLPARRLEDIDIEERIDNLLKNKSIYITGNYFKGLSLEDCVTRSKSEAERFLTLNS